MYLYPFLFLLILSFCNRHELHLNIVLWIGGKGHIDQPFAFQLHGRDVTTIRTRGTQIRKSSAACVIISVPRDAAENLNGFSIVIQRIEDKN